MGVILLIAILATPLIEFAVLVQVGTQIGTLLTVGLSIATAAIGVAIARSQGLAVIARLHSQARGGTPLARDMISGAFIAIAGLMLFIPGFISDIIGFLLLISPLRLAIAKQVMKNIYAKSYTHRSHYSSQDNHPTQERIIIIEGDYHDMANNDKEPR